MKRTTLHSQSRITQMGKMARACLESGQRGKVLAVFSKAIYLLTGSNELFWLTTEDSPMHRRGALSSTSLPEPSAGLPFRVEGHHLVIDSVSPFKLTDASVWTAPSVDSKNILEITRLSEHINSSFSNLDLSQAQGFGTFLSKILALAQNESSNIAPQSVDPVLVTAQPLILNMAHACLTHQPAQISRIAGQLIGLGTGLTPSGDDFLGGMLFAINILQQVYPDRGFKKYIIPIESYRSKTHLISFTLLNDLASGHAIEPLHHIINGLLNGESFERIQPFVLELTRVGHSTGWDLFSGLLVGLTTTYGSPKSGDFG